MIKIRTISSLIYLILICQLLLVSCVGSKDTLPINIEENYVNQQILLRTPDFSNSFRTTDPINLELKYNSSNEIVFPNNYNLRIFDRTDGEWIEITEKPTERLPPGDIILSPKKEMPAVEDIFLLPDLENPLKTYLLRIYVLGAMKTSEGIKQVAAYVDVTLHP